jgi:uncharacterized protein YndB with AHSA1/START domain
LFDEEAGHVIMSRRNREKVMRYSGVIHSTAGILAAALFLAGPARADVVNADATGFQVKTTLTVAAPPAKVYAAFSKVGKWWNPEHTWSGNSANLSLSTKPGGCFCEKLENGGGAQHMVVVYAAPGKELRLNGALGPLQTEAAIGNLALTLNPKDDGTELTWVYSVSGYTKGGWTAWAPDVDAVLNEQFTRLKGYVETGKAQ